MVEGEDMEGVFGYLSTCMNDEGGHVVFIIVFPAHQNKVNPIMIELSYISFFFQLNIRRLRIYIYICSEVVCPLKWWE
jgi:hypothetical protein